MKTQFETYKQLVMGEMFIRMDSKKFGKKKLEEAFIQKWVDGKIIYQPIPCKILQLQ